MTATESHRLAKTGIPNRQKTDPEPAVSCKNGYFRPAAPPPGSTAWRFFTADLLRYPRVPDTGLRARAVVRAVQLQSPVPPSGAASSLALDNGSRSADPRNSGFA